jgi:hypothetical protein
VPLPAPRGLAAAAAPLQLYIVINYRPPQNIGGVHAPTERTSVRAGDAAAAARSVLRTKVTRAKRIVGGAGWCWRAAVCACFYVCVIGVRTCGPPIRHGAHNCTEVDCDRPAVSDVVLRVLTVLATIIK